MERKLLVDLVASLTGGKRRYRVGELAALPGPRCVVEDRYSQMFKLDHVRPAVIVDRLAELHIRWPVVPVVFCETRGLAEEWTYRYLAAAEAWAITEHLALHRISPGNPSESTTSMGHPRRAGTQHRRIRLGPRHRLGRARPRPTPTRNPASLARRAPHHLKPKPSNTHTTFARYSSSASKSPRPQLKSGFRPTARKESEELST